MRHHTPNTQRGFAAIAAIFLVVVLAALGGFMLTFSNTQQLTSAQDLQGSRAYWAARAGLEWGVGSVSAVASPGAIVSTTCTTATPMVIDNISVAVSCATPVAYMEAGSPRYIVQIKSVASITGGTVGSIGYIERSISASIER
jgi:MSHA biogenesis protein MshP